MTLIVEQGIVQDTLHGSVMAWRFLAANDVPLEIERGKETRFNP